MKKIILLAFATAAICLGAFAQTDNSKYIYGLKGGINICNLVNGSSIGARTKLGYSVTLLADQSANKNFGMRDEFTYSREGFKYRNATSSGNIDFSYINFTHLFAWNLGDIAQIHAGPQVSFLLNAMGDSIRNVTSTNITRFFSVSGQTNRLNLGGSAGIEFYPWKGLLLGVRYNLGFLPVNKKQSSGNMYARIDANSKPAGPLKTQVLQIHLGWRSFKRY